MPKIARTWLADLRNAARRKLAASPYLWVLVTKDTEPVPYAVSDRA